MRMLALRRKGVGGCRYVQSVLVEMITKPLARQNGYTVQAKFIYSAKKVLFLGATEITYCQRVSREIIFKILIEIFRSHSSSLL